MQPLDINQLKSRYDQAMSISQRWAPTLDTAYGYVMPDRNGFYFHSVAVQKDVQVFDTTAVIAAKQFASKLHSTLTPPFVKWADLTAGAQVKPEERDNYNRGLEAISNILFNYLFKSNFDLAINECYMDLAVGTALLKIDEGSDDNPLVFKSIPIYQVGFEEDMEGTLTNAFWKWIIKARDIKQLWPDATLSEGLAQIVRDKPDYDIECHISSIIIGYKNDFPIHQYSVVYPGENKVIYQFLEPSSPFVAFRWSKLAGDVFGRGPAINALKSIKILNKLIENELKAGDLAINPPMMVLNNAVVNYNNFRIEPNALIAVNGMAAGNEPIRPLVSGANFQFSEAKAEDYRQQINKHFYTDPLGPIDSPAKTATEIIQRQQQLMEEIGPAFGRLQVEFLTRVIDRCLYILGKKGLLPMLKVDGKTVAVEYRSPLARSQSQSEVMNFTNMYQTLTSVMGPEMSLMTINPEVLPEWLAERFGVDFSLVKSPAEIEQVKQQVAQLAQQQALQQLPQPEAAGVQ